MAVEFGFGSNHMDGKCDRCGAKKVRILLDGDREFCSMGCLKAALDAPKGEVKSRARKVKE